MKKEKLLFLKNRSIKEKIMWYLIIIFIILLLSFALVSGVTITRYSKNTISMNARQAFLQAETIMESHIENVISTSDMLYYDQRVQNTLKESGKKLGFREDYDKLLQLDSLLNSLRGMQNIYRICLYVPDNLSFAEQNYNYFNFESFRETAAFACLKERKNTLYCGEAEAIPNDNFSPEGIQAFPLYRTVYDLNDVGSIIGVIKIYIQTGVFQSLIDAADITQGGIVYIQDTEGNIVLTSNGKIKDRITGDNFEVDREFTNEYREVSGRKYMISCKDIDGTNWKLIMAIPYSEILKPSFQLIRNIIVLMLVIGTVAGVFCYALAVSVSARLLNLNKSIQEICKGKFELNLENEYQDEIGCLYRSYNYMIERIDGLMNEKFLLGKELRNAEFKVLQAQINPHFLYNALELISWKGVEADSSEVTDIAQTLARFYRIGLNQGNDIIPLRKELEHVATYVKLQNYRFDNRIHLEIEIESGSGDCRIPKLTLQPIVENAIIHGILNRKDKEAGCIWIKSYIEDESVRIVVRDNGTGMTSREIQEALSLPEEHEEKGYGIWNIQQRIKLYYGLDYGITFESEKQKGTVVVVSIPKT